MIAEREGPKRYPAQAAFCAMCGTGAIIWINGGNVCYEHYIELAKTNAERYCVENVLDTTKKKIEHCRRLLGLFIERQKERTPGEDDA